MSEPDKSIGDEKTVIKAAGTHSYAFAPGSTLGSYKIIKSLGAGGMGEVYLVEHVYMHKRYALKVLPRALFNNPQFVDRFRIEARVMADLQHPHIVQVHHMDEQNGVYYLTMDYVAGSDGNPQTLDDLMKRSGGKLDEALVERIMRQTCEALAYAHSFRGEGVIHRDLKPSNILLEGGGESSMSKAQSVTPFSVKIADFGLAKVVGSDYLQSVIERSISLSLARPVERSIGDEKTVAVGGDPGSDDEGSSTRSILGTFEYMSPEQKRGEVVDARSDLYALGIMLYAMLTGRKPEGRWKLPSQLGCSKGWDAVVERCLEPDADERFQSAEEMIAALPAGRGQRSAVGGQNREWARNHANEENLPQKSAESAEKKVGTAVPSRPEPARSESTPYQRTPPAKKKKTGWGWAVGVAVLVVAVGIPFFNSWNHEQQETQKKRNIADVEKAKAVLTLPAGAMTGAMGADNSTVFAWKNGFPANAAASNLFAVLRLKNVTDLDIGGERMRIGSITEKARYLAKADVALNAAVTESSRGISGTASRATSAQKDAKQSAKTSGKNVCLYKNGGRATADSEGVYLGDRHPASAAIDGDVATDWCNSWNMPGWLKVQFDNIYTIDRISVTWGKGAHNQTYSISISKDGRDWKQVVAKRRSKTDAGDNPSYHGNTEVVREEFSVEPQQAQYIKVDVIDTSAPGGHIFKAIIHEVEAYAVGTQVAVTPKAAVQSPQSRAPSSRTSPQEGRVWAADLGSGVQMEFVPISAGSFMMGSENGDGDEKPVHRVTLTKPFWMAKTEVTQAQYQQVMGNNPSYFKGSQNPVEQVSWNDAMEFCRRLTDRERQAGRLPEGWEYTLPTEAQWEYACRAGTTGDYAGNLDSMAWYSSNSGGQTHPVGTKQSNAWGLYDMHGNVWEWCSDWYGDYPSGSVTDPRGASSGSRRVDRGGSWDYIASYCRSADRDLYSPGFTYFYLGFRPLVQQK